MPSASSRRRSGPRLASGLLPAALPLPRNGAGGEKRWQRATAAWPKPASQGR